MWYVNVVDFLDFKLTPCFESCMYSFGYFPGVRLWFADVSESSISSIQPLKMELIEGSETSANHNRTPGKYPKEYIQDFDCWLETGNYIIAPLQIKVTKFFLVSRYGLQGDCSIEVLQLPVFLFLAAANCFWRMVRAAALRHAPAHCVRTVTPLRLPHIFSFRMAGFPLNPRLNCAYYGAPTWRAYIPATVSNSMHFTYPAVISKSNSTKSPASGTGKVSESWLMPNVKRVREFVCP